MDYKEKAEQLFDIIMQSGKTLVQIPMDCSQGETGTLLYLTFKRDGVTASEISENLKVSLPRMVVVLNSLEKKQLIQKITDKEDKRKIIVNITKEGKTLILEKKDEAINKMTTIMKNLNEKEVEQYLKLVKKIGKIIGEMQE